MSDVSKLITTRLKIDGEAEYNNKLKQISGNMGNLKSAMSKLTAEYAGNMNSQEALTKKGEILNKQLEEQTKKQAEVTAMLNKAKEAHENIGKSITATKKAMEEEAQASGTSTEKYKELESALESHNESLEKAANSVSHFQKELNYADAAVARANTALQNNSKYLNEAENSSDRFATSINGAGKEVEQATNGLAALAAVLAATGLLRQGINDTKQLLKECAEAASEFEASMSSIAAATGSNADDINAISGAIRQTALRTGQSVNDLAKGARDLMEVGSDVGLVVNQLSAGTDLAIATNTDYGRTFDFLSAAMKTFRLDAEESQRVSDSFAYTTVKTNTNLSDLAEAFTNAGGAASNAGLDINDVNAHLVVFAENGLKGGAAGTALNGIIRNLTAPTEKASDALNELNVALYDSNGASRDMFDVMADLEKALSSQTDEQRNRYQQIIFDNVALKGWNMVTADGVGTVKELSAEISRSSGAFDGMGQAAGMAGRMMEGSQGNVMRLNAAVNELRISIGEALLPAMNTLTGAGTDLAAWAAEYIQQNEWLVHAVTALTVALGILVTGAAAATAGITALKKAIIALKAAKATATGGLTLLISAIGAAVAAAASLALTIGSATSEVDEFKKSLDAVAEAQKEMEKETAVAATLAERYVDRLRELEAAADGAANGVWKNADAQAEYARVTYLLNSTIPDINATINEQTGLIEGGTDAIIDNIAAWKDLALTQAMLRAGQAYMDAEAEAAYALREAQVDLTEAKLAHEPVAKAHEDALEKRNQIYKKAREVAEELLGVEQLMTSGYTDHQLAISFLSDEYHDVQIEIHDLTQELHEYDIALKSANESVEEKTEILRLAEEETKKYREVWEEVLEISTKATDTTEDLTCATEDLTDELEELTSVVNGLQKSLNLLESAMNEQAQSSEISIDTMWRLIEAGHAAAISFDEETGAIRINEEATWDLIDAKYEAIEAQLEAAIAAQELTVAQANAAASAERAAAMAKITAPENFHLADSYWEVARAAAAAAEAEEGSLEGLQAALAAVQSARANRDTVRSSGSSGGGTARTPTEREADPVEEMRRVYNELRNELDFRYKMEKISTEEYYDELIRLRDKYLAENTQAWRSASIEISNIERNELSNKEKLITQTYSQLRNELDFRYKMEKISTEEYYRELGRLRDKYLAEHTQAWRSASIELRDIERNELSNKEQLMIAEFNEAVRRRQDQIRRELDLERQRLNTIIDNINKEIQARRELRKDEDAEQKIRDAQRHLEAAQAKREHARDASEIAQADRLIAQRQQALDAAIRSHEDQLWLRGKQAEIEAARRQIESLNQIEAERIENAAKDEQAAIFAAVKANAERTAAALAISGFSQALIDTLTGNTVNNKSATINVTHAHGQLSSSQITAAVIKALDLL